MNTWPYVFETCTTYSIRLYPINQNGIKSRYLADLLKVFVWRDRLEVFVWRNRLLEVHLGLGAIGSIVSLSLEIYPPYPAWWSNCIYLRPLRPVYVFRGEFKITYVTESKMNNLCMISLVRI